MPHYTGSGLPAQRTATVFEQTTGRIATIYSDVGMTIEIRNPFPLVNGAYDYYSAVATYLAVGVSRPIYVDLGLDDPVDRDEYLAGDPNQRPRQQYNPTNVTVLRDGDFSLLAAADVRSILGTLIQDLKDLGVLK